MTATRGRLGDPNAADAEGGEHAQLARGEPLAGAQHGLAHAHVGAGDLDVGAGSDRLVEAQRRPLDLAVLDHLHGVGAAGDHASGGHLDRRAVAHLRRGHGAGRRGLGGQLEADRRVLLALVGVGRPHRVAVHEGPVEGRHVDRHQHVAVEHAALRLGQGHLLAVQRAEAQRGVPDALGLGLAHGLQEVNALASHHRLVRTGRPRPRCPPRAPRRRAAR